MRDINEIKISVIIPVYDTAAYVEKMLRSLIEQTLAEIEMICVDDGSKDGSSDILRQLQKEDDRIRIYEQMHRGAGAARNFGLGKAHGEYVIFLDADDFFEPAMLEKIWEKGSRCAADVVLFGACRYDNRTGEVVQAPRYLWKKLIPKQEVFSRKDMDGELFGLTTPSPWTKAFRRQFVLEQGIRFQEIPNSNDVFFVLVSMAAAEKITIVDDSLVYYRFNRNSSLQVQKHNHPLCFLTAYEAAYDELVRRGLYEDVSHGFCNMVLSGCVYNLNTVRREDAYWDMVRALCSERFARMGLLDFPDEYYDMLEYKERIKGLPYALRVHETKKRDPQGGNLHLKYGGEYGTKPLVSVIIAVYNMEQYLRECLDSIVGQTLKELEIICIDDGSADASMEILREYAQRDDRITVYSQKNRGLSVTRNRGLERASAKYVYFMDCDDWIIKDGLEKLYQHAERDRTDIIYFNGISFFENEELKVSHPEFVDYYLRKGRYPEVCSGTDMFLYMTKSSEYRVNVGIQFYRREFLSEHKLRFQPGILHEDNGFTFCAMLLAKRAGYHAEAYFMRRVRSESIMTKQVSFAHAYGYFCSYMEIMQFLNERDMQFSEEVMLQAYAVLRGVIGNAKNQFHELTPEEKYASDGLRGLEKIRFQLYVEEDARTHAALMKKQATLMRTYAEKSEINRKLQVTYGEKFERGLEIKRLNQEVRRLERENARIRKSRSYRLARILGFPTRILRRIVKKIRGRENQHG